MVFDVTGGCATKRDILNLFQTYAISFATSTQFFAQADKERHSVESRSRG